MKQTTTAPVRASADQIIHHDPGGYSGVQGFRAAAHGQAEMMGGNSLDCIGDTIAFIADDKDKGRGDIAPLIEGFTVQLGR